MRRTIGLIALAALAGWTRGAPADTEPESQVVVNLVDSPEDEAARRALSQRVTLNVERETVRRAIDRLGGQAGLKWETEAKPEDKARLEAALDRGVSVQVRRAPIGEALDRVTAAAGLDYELRRGVIVVRPGSAGGRLLLQRARDRRRIEEILAKPVNLEFPGTSFDNVIDFLQDLTNLNIVTDRIAASAEGITPQTMIKLKLANVRLGAALTLIVDQVNLDYLIKDQVVYVTGRKEARLLRLAEALETPVTLSVEKKPLAEVLLELNRQCGAVALLDGDTQRRLPLAGQTPVTLEVKEVEARRVYEFLATLFGLRMTESGEDGKVHFTADGATTRPAADDPIVARIVTKEADGRTVELFIRRSELPERLRAVRQERLQAIIKMLEGD